MKRRRQRSHLALGGFLVGAAIAHPLAVTTYDALWPPPPVPPPKLTIKFAGAGQGTATIEGLPDGTNVTCSGTCERELERGRVVTVQATPAEGSFLDGWSYRCADDEPFSQCTVRMDVGRELTIFFEEIPEDVEIEYVAVDETDDSIELPDPEVEVARLDEPIPPEQLPPPDVPALELPPEPELPPVLPPPTPLAPQPPPPPPPEVAKAEPPPPDAPRPQPRPQPPMKSVEVADDEHVVEKAPDDATFLSDKNRNVEEETHAEDTNLERESTGGGVYSEKSDNKDEEVGGEETVIAELEDTEETDLEAEDEAETSHTGDDEVAKGLRAGEEGEGGEDGDGGDGGDGSKDPGVMAMRGIAGRGTPGGPKLPTVDEDLEGVGGEKGKRGKKGKRGIKTDLTFEDYERIVGDDKADEEVRIARRRMSRKKGRWQKKIDRVNSSLENFTPEVRPGNQTALKTRAAPFAVYIARMHRKIHELWGFGFLVDVESLPADHELNDQTLAVTLEIAIDRDGLVDKATIVRPSGSTMFDVAALDAVFSSEPYDKPPEELLSKNGKLYVQWQFNRDHKQCGTFGAQPFILDNPPADSDESEAPGLFGDPRERRRNKGREVGTAPVRGEKEGDSAGAAARATANLPTPDDPQAERAALAWMAGFEHADVSALVAASGTPFSSGGQVVANTSSALGEVYTTILRETKQRKVTDWRVMSPAGYRRMFGSLPPGLTNTTSSLFLVIKVGSERFTLELRQQSDGSYRATGFYR